MAQSASDLKRRLDALHRNRLFEGAVISIIIVSALLIGARTYEGVSRFDQVMGVLDWAVTVFFLIEILIRMAAEERLRDFFRERWNVFDFIIVVASLIPIDDSEMVLLARLLRIFRVLRLVSLIPELRILMGSLFKAIPRMGYVVLLMFIIFYIYGAFGSFLFGHINDFLWGNIARSMLTLFRIATFEDWTDVMYETQEVYPLSWIYYLSFLFLTAFIFLNMMIGIVLQVMEKESQRLDEENGEGEAVEVHQIHERMEQLQQQLDRIESSLERQERTRHN